VLILLLDIAKLTSQNLDPGSVETDLHFAAPDADNLQSRNCVSVDRQNNRLANGPGKSQHWRPPIERRDLRRSLILVNFRIAISSASQSARGSPPRIRRSIESSEDQRREDLPWASRSMRHRRRRAATRAALRAFTRSRDTGEWFFLERSARSTEWASWSPCRKEFFDGIRAMTALPCVFGAAGGGGIGEHPPPRSDEAATQGLWRGLLQSCNDLSSALGYFS